MVRRLHFRENQVREEPGELIYAMAHDRRHAASASSVASLLDRAKSGDAAAFEDIVIRYERQLYRTALRLLGHREDAQDAVQEVFLRFHKYLARFDETRELEPWLYRITVNACRTIGKKRRRAAAIEIEKAPAEDVASPCRGEAAVELDEARQIVVEGLKRLSEKERAALVLRDIEGLSTKEVARILGSSETTVRSQISRARVKMKRYRHRMLGGGQ